MSAATLLLIAAGGIALLLVLVIGGKLQAFVALLLVSIVVALVAGIPPGEIPAVIETGMGETLGFVAVVVGLGTMIGQLVEVTGGGRVVADSLVRRFGEERAPWGLGLTGFLIAIPVFFDVGLIILIPLVYSVAKRLRRSLMYYAIPTLAGLAVTHSFIPPTPGPVAVAELIGADLGWVILWGLVAGLPAFVIGGILFGKLVGDRMDVDVPGYMEEAAASVTEGDDAPAPAFGLVVGIILIPLALILVNTLSTVVLEEGSQAARILGFVGHPFTALLLATLLAFYVLGIRRGYSRDKVQQVATAALEPVGIIVLVTGAGGVFGEVLVQSGVGEALANVLEDTALPLIVLAFLIAVAVRVSQGSATVSAVTAASIAAPIVEQGDASPPELGLLVIAIASGATVLSHVNDSGFWLVNRYLGLSVGDTLKSWTVLETILGVVGFVIALLLSLVV